MAGSYGNANSLSPSSVCVIVVGDHGTGKSSLIVTAAIAKAFPSNVPPLLPPTQLRRTIIPTMCRLPENQNKLAKELKKADVVVLTYACDDPATLDRLSTFWLPELRRLEFQHIYGKIQVKVLLIVVGCKLDLHDDQQPVSLEQVMSPIM